MKEKIVDRLKEFSISSIGIDNATSVFLLTFMILLFGVQAYINMPKEQFPDSSLPTIFINTPYFGNSAEEIENLITRPIEKEVNALNGVKKVLSTSMQDYSVMVVEFNSNIETEEALLEVKDAIDKAKNELPNDLDQDPIIDELNFGEIPVMVVNVAGSYGMDDLRKYAELIQDRIEDISEVSEARMGGDLERELKINIDLLKMTVLKVNFGDIETAVARENITMSGGEITTNGSRRSVRIVGQFETAEEIKNLIITAENQKPIYLKDLAEVEFGFEERTSYSKADGLPVISLEIIKRSGENLLSTSDKIKIEIEKAELELPSGVQLSIFNDLSLATRNEVANLENSIISGVILVIMVLLFFLGLRNAMFVGLAIPLSMMMGIMILNILGITMNVVVLFALILALGLLVDNAIVVVENIYRYQQNGYDPISASKYGTGEIAWPIIASTATTLAAFLPLLFWPGIMGIFMQYMPITLIAVLSSSLFVALVINPVFTSRFMRVEKNENQNSSKNIRKALIGLIVMFILMAICHLINIIWLRNLILITAIFNILNILILKPASQVFQQTIIPALEKTYNNFIAFALKGFTPVFVFGGTIVLLFAAGYLLKAKQPPVEFFPVADPLYINVFVELPFGADIEETYKVTQEIETKINVALEPYEHIVDAVLVQVGENTSDPNEPPEPGLTPYKSRITVAFEEFKNRNGISTFKILEDIRENIQGYPGVKVLVKQNASGPPTGKAINLEIKSENIDSLLVFSSKLIKEINATSIAGIENLDSDVQLEKPELLVNIDRDAVRRYGISTGQVASTLRNSVFGKEISKFKVGEDEYPIVTRLNSKSRNNITDLINQRITFRNQLNGQLVQVPISSVADFEYSSTYNAIKRKDNKRVITISSDVLEGYNATEVNAELKQFMSEYDLPAAYSYSFSGEQQQQAEDAAFLSQAFLIALFLIFIIIVTQFNSLISPFIIIISVLFSTIGVFLGYIVTNSTVVIILSGVGIISLAGIVVNNAIVLIDYINLLVKRKRESLELSTMTQMIKEDVKSCIIEGGATRLRPVLLTAITTVLGLIPLAIGLNFNFFSFVKRFDPEYFVGGDNTAMWGPLAWTIIYGIIFATFLTLVVIPVMYWLAYRVKRKVVMLLTRKENTLNNNQVYE